MILFFCDNQRERKNRDRDRRLNMFLNGNAKKFGRFRMISNDFE